MSNRHQFEGGCRRGYAFNEGEVCEHGCGHPCERWIGAQGGVETLPERPGMGGRPETLPERPGRGGHFETLPERPHMRGDGQEGRHAGRGRGGHPGPEDDFRGHRGPGGEGRHHGPMGDFPGPEGDFPGRGGFHGHRGPGPEGGFRGRGGPGPVPEDLLRERIDEAGLAELLELAGRMLHRRPGGDAGRGQALALSILAGRERMSQRELQQLLGVQPGSMSELVAKLERKGLLTRARDEDRRGNLLSITEAGRTAIPGEPADPEGTLFSALTEAQRDTLQALLRTLLNDWATRLDGGRGQRPPRDPGAAPADGSPRTVQV